MMERRRGLAAIQPRALDGPAGKAVTASLVGAA